MTVVELGLPAGAVPLAYCSEPGEPQRTIYTLLDGDFILVESGKILARANPKAIDNLAVAIVCGDPQEPTKPGEFFALALLVVSRSILRSRAAPSNPHPALAAAARGGAT